jgi:hypothetical protein
MEQGQKCLISDYQLNNMLDSSGQHWSIKEKEQRLLGSESG